MKGKLKIYHKKWKCGQKNRGYIKKMYIFAVEYKNYYVWPLYVSKQLKMQLKGNLLK